MKLSCSISTDYSGNPRIKLTKDCPQVTLDIITEDINLLKSLVDTELFLVDNVGKQPIFYDPKTTEVIGNE